MLYIKKIIGVKLIYVPIFIFFLKKDYLYYYKQVCEIKRIHKNIFFSFHFLNKIETQEYREKKRDPQNNLSFSKRSENLY